MIFLALTNVAIVLTSALSVIRIRSALGEAERQLMLYAWHLRGFVPDSARGARTSRGAAYADRVAQADGVYEPSRDSWFRIGDLVHDGEADKQAKDRQNGGGADAPGRVDGLATD